MEKSKTVLHRREAKIYSPHMVYMSKYCYYSDLVQILALFIFQLYNIGQIILCFHFSVASPIHWKLMIYIIH